MTKSREAQRYFTDVVLTHAGEDCLIWPYSRNNRGYAQLVWKGKPWVVSRLVCEHQHGPPMPKTLDAAHSCGHGKEGCVTPAHLSWKTRKENVADARMHGTLVRGEKIPGAKLTVADVRMIRKLAHILKRPSIAKKFNVEVSAIHHILQEKTWTWVDETTSAALAETPAEPVAAPGLSEPPEPAE